MGIGRAQFACCFTDKTHLDIGAGQVVAHQPLLAVQRLVDVTQVVRNFTVDTRRQRRAGLAQTAHIQLEQQRQHGGTFGVMQPLLVGFELRPAG